MVPNAGSGEQLQEVVDRLQRDVAELRRSRRRLAQAAYADRRAIERDLHDGVQQYLVALAVQLRRLTLLVEGDQAGARALLDEMASTVQEALAETTGLAQRVYPQLLDVRGFAGAVRSAAESAGVTVLVDAPASARHPPEITAALYLSCIDALSSRSPGSEATVRVHDADGALTFEIAIAGQLAEDRLERLRDRIEALDGRVSVEHPEDGGSRIHGWLSWRR